MMFFYKYKLPLAALLTLIFILGIEFYNKNHHTKTFSSMSYAEQLVNSKLYMADQPRPYQDSPTFLWFGDSFVSTAINPTLLDKAFTNTNTINFGLVAALAPTASTYFLLKRYLNQNKTIRGVFLVYTIDGLNENIESIIERGELFKTFNNFSEIFSYINKVPINKTVNAFLHNLIPSTHFNLFTRQNIEHPQDLKGYYLANKQFLNDITENKGFTPIDIKKDIKKNVEPLSFDNFTLYYLEKTLVLLKEKNIPVFFSINSLPESLCVAKLNSNIKQTEDSLLKFYQYIQDKHPQVNLIDLPDCLPDSLYADPEHLNPAGSNVFNKMLLSFLPDLPAKQKNKKNKLNKNSFGILYPTKQTIESPHSIILWPLPIYAKEKNITINFQHARKGKKGSFSFSLWQDNNNDSQPDIEIATSELKEAKNKNEWSSFSFKTNAYKQAFIGIRLEETNIIYWQNTVENGGRFYGLGSYAFINKTNKDQTPPFKITHNISNLTIKID